MARRRMRVRPLHWKDHMLRRDIKPYLSLTLILLALAGPAMAQEVYECVRVVDGDSIVFKINCRNEKVRLMGVDTRETDHPEKPVEHFGKKPPI